MAPREDMAPLTVTTTSVGGGLWVAIRGEVDLANRDQLRRSLAAIRLGRARLVYLDLTLTPKSLPARLAGRALLGWLADGDPARCSQARPYGGRGRVRSPRP